MARIDIADIKTDANASGRVDRGHIFEIQIGNRHLAGVEIGRGGAPLFHPHFPAREIENSRIFGRSALNQRYARAVCSNRRRPD